MIVKVQKFSKMFYIKMKYCYFGKIVKNSRKGQQIMDDLFVAIARCP